MAENNPYVGPTSFEEDDRGKFFGRADETRELISLVIARRAVLLYAQSGAGKTSLLKAAVIPKLKEDQRIQVSPIARVAGQADDRAPNPFIANALSTLLNSPALQSGNQTLKDALAPLLDRSGPHAPYLLVFDQFEEIFTWHPELYEQRAVFFQQLNQALAAFPHVSLLLAMREDYLADLDSFASHLPDRLRSRMRMEQLRCDRAIEAVRQPAVDAGKPFAPGVAEKLVDNLRRIQRSQPEGGAKTDPPLGKYIAPVQLQIVCWQLWSRLAPAAASITLADVDQFGNVDDALTRFYADALAEALKTAAISERALRRWVSEKLITAAETRGLVYQDVAKGVTEGLPNAVTQTLDRRFIIRPVKRGDDTWYELAHDRLVKPIIDDNKNWLATYRNPVADAHQNWLRAGRDPAKLLTANQLTDAQKFAASHPLEVTADETSFLSECAAEAARSRKRRRTTRQILAVAGLLLIAIAGYATIEAVKARDALAAARKASSQLYLQQAEKNADDDPDLALIAARTALTNDPTSVPARAWVSNLLLNRAWWTAGEHANTGPLTSSEIGPIRSVAFSPDGHTAACATSNLAAIWDTDTGRHVRNPLIHEKAVQSVAFSPDGRRLVTFEKEGQNSVWDVAGGRPLSKLKPASGESVFAVFAPDNRTVVTLSTSPDLITVWNGETAAVAWSAPEAYRLYGAAFTPDGAHLVTYSLGGISRWNARTGAQEGAPVPAEKPLRLNLGWISSVAFSPDTTRVVEIHADWTFIVKDAVSGQQISVSPKQQGPLESARFSSDGRYIVTASDDRSVRVWDADSARLVGVAARTKRRMLSAAFSPDATRIVTGDDSVTTQVWHTASGHPPALPTSAPSNQSRPSPLAPDEPGVSSLIVSGASIAFSRAGDKLVALNSELGAQVSLPDSGRAAGQPIRSKYAFTSVQFNCDGTRVVTASKAGAEVWDAASGTRLAILRADDLVPFTAVYSPDCKTILGSGPFPQLWNAATGKQVGGNMYVADGQVLSATFSQDGKSMVFSGDQGHTSVNLGGDSRLVIDSRGAVFSVFSPDAANVLIADNESAHIWHVEKATMFNDFTPTLVGHALQHRDLVNSVAYGPDGTWVVTASWDKTARLWDAKTGTPIGVSLLHPAGVVGVAARPGGRQIATLAKDGVARLWTVLLGDGTEHNSMQLAQLAEYMSNNATTYTGQDLARRVAELRQHFGIENR